MIPVSLLATSSMLPGRPITSEEVAARAIPPLDPGYAKERAGIVRRHCVERETRSAPIAAGLLRQALAAADMDARDLRRIVFVSSFGGDWLAPSTASRVTDELGLSGQCDCFDLNNACIGFLSGLDVAARSVATGLGPVAVVVVEILSDMLTPEDRRCLAVFGDAAAAVVLGPGSAEYGVLGTSLHNDPTPGLTVYLKHPRWTGAMEPLRFGMGNRAMAEAAVGYMVGAARQALAQAGMRIHDVDWILPHQPNGPMFDQTLDALEVPRHKAIKLVHEIGSTGAAAIPFSLDQLVQRGVRPGDTVLMVGVGGGAGYGATVLRVGNVRSGSKT
ncbi:MAG: ketoacyl-ACP synthase III [Myxococcales bacterium]|nr:ketoacyl-ACP synthase III [Myxococcales bacterium]